VSGVEAWEAAAETVAGTVIARADRGDRFLWELGGGPQCPGGMNGLSGLGLHLLSSKATY